MYHIDFATKKRVEKEREREFFPPRVIIGLMV